ncbi:MAG: M18 family aminopeptidase [Filifactoraceae bacterium]
MFDTEKFLDFLTKSKNQYFVSSEIEKIAVKNGFKKLILSEKWKLEKCCNYYVTLDGSIFLFSVGETPTKFNIITSHTDSPCMMIKPNPIIIENGYIKLNVDVYGGPILNTWFDRPLGIAGKVSIINNEGNVSYKLFDMEKVAIIPNLAVHQNREVNNGVTIGRQKDILPILGFANENTDKNYLDKLIANKLDIDYNNILDYTLYTYVDDSAKLIGSDNQIISSPRLDDLAMVYSSVSGLIEAKVDKSINIVAAFDNEEVGSNTIYGADSNIFNKILERIGMGLNIIGEDFDIMIGNSSMISADMAHAIHPNFPEKSDLTNKLFINKGIAIKRSIGKYASFIESSSNFIKLCKDNQVEFQYFVNRNDIPSGSTVGPVISTLTCIPTVDVGAPMLAMHSSVELMGIQDYKNLCKIFMEYFKS